MTKKLPKCICDLIKDLLATQSPGSHIAIIYKFLAAEEIDMEDKYIKDLIVYLQTKSDLKRLQSSQGGTKTHLTKANFKKRSPSTTWICILKSSYRALCVHCKTYYFPGDPIILDAAGNNGYHPQCAPQIAKDLLAHDKFYNQMLAQKQC